MSLAIHLALRGSNDGFSQSIGHIAILAGLCLMAGSEKRVVGAELYLFVEAVGEAHAIYLSPGELNGQFDRIEFDARPLGDFIFVNPNSGLHSGLPRPAGQRFTYRNRLLETSPDDPEIVGGLGMTVTSAVNLPSHFSFTATSPIPVDTSGQVSSRLFLANIVMEFDLAGSGDVHNALAHVKLLSNGAIVTELSSLFLIPEPGTFCATIAMISIIAPWLRLAHCPRKFVRRAM